MVENYGKTWWGQQWLKSLNNIDYSNRLPRGSSYARKGAVLKLDILENRIKAKVKGSQPRPYNVDIILPPFFDPELGHFIDQLIMRPVIISKLLNRELDPEVLTIAEEMNLKVFPSQWTDFKMQCSCPDWAVPCKHLAAVIYKVCAEIDNDPFLVFSLHQVDLIGEMNKRNIFVSKENSEVPALSALYFKQKEKNNESYNPENAYQKISYGVLPNIHEPLVALLSDYPVFYQGSGNFKEKYSQSLGRVVKNARKILQGKIDLGEVLKNAQSNSKDLNTHSRQRITIDQNYRSKILINDKAFSFPEFLAQLSQVPASKIPDYQPSTAALSTVFHFSLHLLANGAVVPQIVQHPGGFYIIRWLPAMLSKEVNTLVKQMEKMVPPDIFWWHQGDGPKLINKDTAGNVLSFFLTELISLLLEKDSGDLFLDLFYRKGKYAFQKPGEAALCGGIMVWLQKYYITQGNYKPQIVVSESLNDNFLVNINIVLQEGGLQAPVALNEILNRKSYERLRYEVLQSLTQLSHFISGLDNYINTRGEKQIEMDTEKFTPFLFQILPAIQLLDIDVLLPKSLRDILKPKSSLKIRRKKGRSFLRLDQLLEFDWQVAIGDTLISEKEFKKLLGKSDGLIKYKGRYIYVNKDEVEKLHRHFSTEAPLTTSQLLRAALSGDYFGAKIELTDEVRDLIRELTDVKNIALPKGIVAKLRPYQVRGYSWMYRNAKIGFGSVIADDMGLGKTLQVITTLLKYKEDGLLKEKSAMVVAPTGLLTNWQAEIEKFAPQLNVHLYHGPNRKIKKGFDILLTSYGIARTEAAKLKKLPWHTLVIDEAQNIKNQDTGQTRAIKSISAENFIAMSGTPVENRLSELWSILDYSNRGFLGNQKEFHETFGSPIEIYNDTEVADKLKKVTAPFLMRRLKTDKTIISDLPDKIEMDCFSVLLKEQASLYEKTLEEAMKEIEGVDTTDKKGLFVRQGLVLQMILALKQICNHPTQFLKNNLLDASLSGKLELLFNKLDSIVESNEKVLVFTQFREMGKLLQHFISERYGEVPLFYHGGCSLKQRKEMVDLFQNNHADKIFILSLKAAGTGLNLTAATHVIHYDLWWNPAVEAQATDRAYRIGQKNNVMVHRLITKNTFEERINEMIQSKKALANLTVATGENWIGNLSNRELKELFVLS